MSNAKKRRRFRWFPLLVCVIIVINAAAIYYILNRLNGYLADYEAVQPYRTVERYIDELKSGDYSTIAEYAGYTPEKFDSEGDFGEYMKALIGDTSGISYTKSASAGQGILSYTIYAERGGENVRLQEITLTETGDRERPYDISFDIERLGAYTIEAPSDATVYVNGIALDDSYKTGEPVVNESFKGILTEGIRLPSRCSYTVGGMLLPPEITATDSEGVPCAVSVSEKGDSYSFSMPVGEGERFDEYAGMIEKATCIYARFITEDAKFAEVTGLVYTDTSFYKAISTFYNGWYINHDSYEFTDIVVENIEQVADNAFTGEISFMYTIKRKQKVYDYPSHYKASFMRFEDVGWKLVNLEVI